MWAHTQKEPRACAAQMQAQTRCASCSPQARELPTAGVPAAGAGVCRAFSSYLSPFPVWLFPLKLLFLCRSGRDGNFLACPLPWLCFRPVGLVTYCFFADFCAHCLFACSALFMRALSCFFALSCLTSSSQTSFPLSLRPRRASTFFRKESRQRFARGRGSAPFEPPFLCPAANLFLFRAAGRLSGPSGRKPPAGRETLEKAKEQSSAFSSVSVQRGTSAPFC